MIRFENVAKKYEHGSYAVKPLSMEIQAGELFVIIGPSGSGKTTTLKMINRLVPMTEGKILIENQNILEYDINELRWNIGYVLQDIALFPHMTIEENIAIVPELKNWEKARIQHRITELLDMVGLDPDEYRNRKPHQLSGGEQQRVGVIRALAGDPKIILMDEPFSALDPISRTKLQDDILKLYSNIQKTIVFVTHDMNEALKLATRICVMKDGEVQQIGTPEEILNQPANDFVKTFVGTPKRVSNPIVELDSIIQLTDTSKDLNPEFALSKSCDLKTIVDRLAYTDELPVENNGEIIGTINRASFYKLMSKRLNESEEV